MLWTFLMISRWCGMSSPIYPLYEAFLVVVSSGIGAVYFKADVESAGEPLNGSFKFG